MCIFLLHWHCDSFPPCSNWGHLLQHTCRPPRGCAVSVNAHLGNIFNHACSGGMSAAPWAHNSNSSNSIRDLRSRAHSPACSFFSHVHLSLSRHGRHWHLPLICYVPACTFFNWCYSILDAALWNGLCVPTADVACDLESLPTSPARIPTRTIQRSPRRTPRTPTRSTHKAESATMLSAQSVLYAACVCSQWVVLPLLSLRGASSAPTL